MQTSKQQPYSATDLAAYFIVGSALGFVFLSLGKEGWINQEHKDQSHGHFLSAYHYYREAALSSSPDDPNHALILRKQIECLCHAYQPLAEILPICSRTQEVAPKSLEIWVPPHDSGVAIMNNLAQIMQFQEWCEQEVAGGRMTLDKMDKFITPMMGVYEDFSTVRNPFQPVLFCRDRDGGTNRMIPIVPVPPPNTLEEPEPSRAKVRALSKNVSIDTDSSRPLYRIDALASIRKEGGSHVSGPSNLVTSD